MAWKKPSQELIELLIRRMEPYAAQKKFMFGSTVYFANDQMFIGVHEDHIFLRLSESGRKALLLAYHNVTQFEPMAGRPMREYMIIPPELYNDREALGRWIEQSMDHVMSMPAKVKKDRKI
jgi:TfoX/Sxy family transcriptional regulator of competence genes